MQPGDRSNGRPSTVEPDQGREAPFYAFARILRQRLWVVVLCAVLVPLVAYAVTSRQDKEYKTSAKLLLLSSNIEQELGEGGPEASPTPTRPDGGIGRTSLDLVSVRAIADRTAKALGGTVTPAQVVATIDVVPNGDSSVVNIVGTGRNPRQITVMANTYARQYIAFRKQTSRDQIRRVRQIVDRQVSDAQRAADAGDVSDNRVAELRDRASRLGLLDKLQTGNAQLVERAEVPGSATSPKPRRTALLGLGFGLLIGLGLATLFDILSRRLNDPGEVEAIYNRPILGAIPATRALSHGNGVGTFELSHGERASFDMVRANLRHYNDFNVVSVLVVSAVPDEGKSTISWNLAVASAQAGNKVLLLEADMRLPTVGKRLDLPAGQGLSDVLMGTAEPEDVIHRVLGQPGQETSTLDLLPAGAPQNNPTYLIESGRMESLLLDLEEHYDFVVIDTPPTSAVPDAISLVDYVGGVMIVTRVRHNTRKAAHDLREQLENIRAPILGVVVNGVNASDMSGPYRYEYTATGRAGGR